VLSAEVKIWERNSSGGYLKLADKTFGGGLAPYSTSPNVTAHCTSGLNVHVEFIGSASSASGVGSWDKNTNPLVCK
jgi:hypothetical protein